ncbi:MAG: hypothetical protein ACTH0V_00455 [Microbacteriaceae bacterium]
MVSGEGTLVNTNGYDFSAFDGPFDRAAAKEFFDSDDPRIVRLEDLLTGRLGIYRIAAIVGIVTIPIGLVLFFTLPEEEGDRLPNTLIGGGVLTIIMFLWELRRSSAKWAYRIARFADANGFAFSHLEDSARYEGMLFTHGTGHHRWMAVNATLAGRRVEFGNLSYTETSGRSAFRRRGYVAMRLPGRLPRMVITKRENPYFPLTIPFYPHPHEAVDVGQGRAFRVYVPEGAEFIARELFTPETTRLFARLARRFSMEIIGDTLLLTRFRQVSTGNARQWRRQLGDMAELARAMNGSGVWSLMRRQPKRFLQGLPEIRLHFMSGSPVLATFAMLGVILAISAVICAVLFLPRMLT